MDEELWGVEERLWTEGAAEFLLHLDPGCLMAFDGAGILAGRTEIMRAIAAGPRWGAVAIEGRRVMATDGLTVLAYLAVAQRPGAPARRAFCTSTWARRIDGWRLVQHQQTPAPGE